MQSWPLWLNGLVFLGAALAIWWAGTRLERNADAISERTGLGHAFTAVLLLAGATSLPELATTVTAVAILGNPTLAVHNLLGGVALQTGLLVVADAVKRRRGALTFFSPGFVLLIQGVGLVMLLQVTVAGVTARGVPTILSTSVWLILLFAVYVGMMYLVHRHREHPRWTPEDADDSPGDGGDDDEGDDSNPDGRRSTRALWLLFVALSAVVLAGGWLAAQTADALAEQTGLGSAFLGATLLAAATSFPELSTTIAASRSGRYTVAFSNIFGSNAFCVCLLLVADVLYRDGTILARAEGPVVFVTTIGAVMTSLYLWGLLERENRTIFGIGWDSAAAALVYAGGMTVLYFIQ